MLSISPISLNVQHKRNEPSFKAIHIDESIPSEIVDAFANSKNMGEIAKLFDINVKKFYWNDYSGSNFLNIDISRVKEAVSFAVPQKQVGKFFSKSTSPAKPTVENKAYEMGLTDKFLSGLFPKHSKPSFVEQIKALTPQSIEEFLKKEELTVAEVKAKNIGDALKREENLKKIANMGK